MLFLTSAALTSILEPQCVPGLCFDFLMNTLRVCVPSRHINQVKSSSNSNLLIALQIASAVLYLDRHMRVTPSVACHSVLTLAQAHLPWKGAVGELVTGSSAPVGSVVWIMWASTRQCLALLLVLETDYLHLKAQNLSDINCSVSHIGRYGTFSKALFN